YDDVMNQQREVIYSLRSFALDAGEELRGEAERAKAFAWAVGGREFEDGRHGASLTPSITEADTVPMRTGARALTPRDTS
ncbi:MAG: hypothetical protein ACKOH8_05100, partial [Gemmatimonadota bacterium]